MNILELKKTNDVNNEINSMEKQNNVLSEILQNAINWSIDAGLKYILPDSIGEKIIEIKNTLLDNNVQNKIAETIKNVIGIGEKKLNIENNGINNIEDMEKILKSPEAIKLLSEVVKEILENNNLGNTNNENIQNSNQVIEYIKNNLDEEITKQVNSINQIEEYSKEWYKCYENKDFEAMNKVYEEISKEVKNVIPLENIIKETKKIENLNELIKSKGGDFNITKEEMELVSKLIV